MSQSSLLTSAQRTFCQARSDQPAPNGPRAKALLALDQGNTQQQAAEQSGLSLGQVRYCLRRFRTVSLEIFDTDSPASTSTAQGDSKTQKVDKEKKKSGKKAKALKPVNAKNEKAEKKADKKNTKTSSKKTKKGDKKDNKKKSGKKGDGKKGAKGSKKKKNK
ncbi:MAG: helix-turn-helix domain-containing protein [Alcanivorax sp.]|uniref:helix-turn-helix domain-containing protein n=1 Tax=Alcanivorax sp. TaxID=1872427 RepID=UPI003DA7962A